MNSRDKGARGEREFASYLRDQGYQARRGQQFAGGPGSPDVVSDFPMHVEVKRTERLSIKDAVAQAEGDSHGKPWTIAYRGNHGAWLAILPFDELVKLVRESEL